ncbi:PREDICTED: uncharacterized protein LOC109477073 isoform X1 [Branchiostoma belcheri]|uniref:Uncharacterized protein LOC109477073 isoform X1 n=1 Tax=Branchiostoma belcheri TaxID=7741 RepID=A0A6P4ZI16_BRABE|nr:PREDICTED: uncharacterized protein LOC109477073 isoform X1 [Branchiostoma belcheri]
MALAHVLILLLAVLTVPDTFATVKRARQADNSELWTWLTTTAVTTTIPTPTPGCVSSYDGQMYGQGSTMPTGGDGCRECTCDDFWSSTVQENCRCICWCYCSPCVDEVSNGCCPTCPNGPNCNAMGTVIPAGMDVQVDGYTCRCLHDTAFPPPHGKRSAMAGRGSPAYGCEPFLQAVCQPIITGR